MFKIVNERNTDHHVHSSTYSDGMNTIEEIVIASGNFGLKEISITDHSQLIIDHHKNNYGFYPGVARYDLKQWQNVHNDVKINFGVEADLINEIGEICDRIQNVKSNYLILSVHQGIYVGDYKKVNEAYENVILKNIEKIKCIGHPCMDYHYKYTEDVVTDYVDIERLTEFANKHSIPLEVNGAGMMNKRENIEKLKLMLEKAKLIMINSDAHTLYQLKVARNFAYNWLEKEGYL